MSLNMQWLPCRALGLVLCLASAWGVAVAAPSAHLTLAAGGHTRYVVLVGKQAPPATRHAAKALSTYLERVTGAQFAVVHTVPAGSRPVFAVGRTAVSRWHLLSAAGDKRLGPDGYRIRTTASGDVLISGAKPRGTLYGVYHFLEQYAGVHWYSAHFESVPRRRRLAIAPITGHTSVPRFRYREVFSRGADNAWFSARSALNGQFGHRIGRELGPKQGGYVAIRDLSIAQLVPRSRYGKSHPGYYGGGQLRFANPQVQRIAVRQVLAKLKQWKGHPPAYLLISHADRNTYFDAGADERLIQQYQAPGAAFFQFVKEIAVAVRRASPQTTVLAGGYLWSQKPPKGMTLPSNMGVMLSDINLDFSKPMDAPDNQVFLRALNGWSALTPHIIIWDYITDFDGYIQPFPNLGVLGPNLKILASHPHVEGVFEEGSYGTRGGAMALLKAWMLAKLLWNPDQNVSKLIHQFAKGYYGAAAPYIERYIRLLENSEQSSSSRLTIKTPPTAAYLSPGFIKRADRLFVQAQEAVRGDPTLLQHVRTARIPVDYVALINGLRLGSDIQDGSVRLARFKQSVKAAHITQYREGGSIKTLMSALRVPRTSPKPPQRCMHKPSDCRVIEEFGLHLAGGAHVVPDSRASDGAAVRMPGTSRVWGIQLPLSELLPPTGSWSIVASVRVSRGRVGGDDDPAAVVLGVNPGPYRTVHLNELADGRYHNVQLKGRWRAGPKKYVWIAPPHSRAVKAVYVDRIFAVRNP